MKGILMDIRNSRLNSSTIQKKHFSHIVVGNDFFALDTYHILTKRYVKEQVHLITHFPTHRDNSSSFFFSGPKYFRGHESLRLQIYMRYQIVSATGFPTDCKGCMNLLRKR